MARVLPVSFLVSGEGTTLDAIGESIAGGHLSARVALVVADRPHVPAIERARRRGFATTVIPTRGVPESEWTERLTAALRAQGTELVVLAGYLSILPRPWVAEWRGRVINLHPSLLPRYGGKGMYGPKVHAAVLAAGERETGATVHLVTDAVDAGPTLLQARIPIEPNDTPDTLRARLHPVEIRLLTEVLRRFADGTWPLPYVPREEPALPREERGRSG
ncbi:MAG: phosphoribosylglycinamide formyltransferase [Thermoplasmata archaeon]